MSGAGVPSVAIIANNPDLSQEVADTFKEDYEEKFSGPVRRPIVLPLGTTITPLGWSPEQSQMVEARKMALVDVANIFNLDSYWLNAPAAGLTYKSPAPLYVALLRTSLEGVLRPRANMGDAWVAPWPSPPL